MGRGRERSLAAKLILECCELFPNASNRALARIMWNNHGDHFNSQEHARSMVRYYRQGNKSKHHDHTEFIHNDLYGFEDLPEGLKSYDDWTPYHIDCEKCLVISDPHVPYHDKIALEVCLEFGYKVGVDAILLNGDFSDFLSVSFWDKDPESRDFQKELDTIRVVLGIIRNSFPKAKIIYKAGNHEERYDRYMKVKAPEIFNVDTFNKSTMMWLDKFNIDLVEDRRIVKIANLNVIHGHEFGGGYYSPVNPAKGLYNKGKENCLGAHHHQTSHHAENSMNDNMVGCWSSGCLSDLHPDYLPINKWNHGFAMVEKYGEKEFQVFNKKIIKGKTFNG